jgi:hypothetical protein
MNLAPATHPALLPATTPAQQKTATNMNAASSRSHCIVTVAVEKACPDGTTASGKLRMVDLAGRWVEGGGSEGRV